MKSPLGRLDPAVGPHFQDKIAGLIRIAKPLTVIETGLETGFGAEFYLQALESNGRGVLVSIDPTLHKDYAPNPIKHDRFEHIQKRSVDALPAAFLQFGPFDFFIHDSDHSALCQTYEYELAWRFLMPGGYLVSDDPWWGQPPHLAFQSFCYRNQAGPWTIAGNALWVRKPDPSSYPSRDETYAKEAQEKAIEIANDYAASRGEIERYP